MSGLSFSFCKGSLLTTRNSFFVCIFLFISVLSFTPTTLIEALKQPKLPTGAYEIKEATLLSQDWKIATINFDVGEELYFPQLVPCFTCYDKSTFKRSDSGEVCVCDFSQKGSKCGRAPKGCPKNTCTSEDRKKFCTDPQLKSWTTLKIAEKSGEKEVITVEKVTLKKDESKYFRLHTADPCRGFKAKVLYESGIVDIHMSLTLPELNDNTQTWTTNGRQYIDVTELDMCPEFKGAELGTYFITVVGRAAVSTFDFEIDSDFSTLDVPEKGAVNAPCHDDPSKICVKEGIPVVIINPAASQVFQFRFDIHGKQGECKNLTVYIQADQGDGGIGGSWSVTNPMYRNGLNPEFHSEDSGSDNIYTQYCFTNGESKASFYVAPHAWAGAPRYTVRFSTNKEAFLKRGASLAPYQYAFSARRVLTAVCPHTNPNVWLWMCEDWKSYCNQFWLVYPAEDPNPFWPPPATWRTTTSPISAALFSQLTDYDVPVRNASATSLSLVMVMSNTLFGKGTVYATEAQLQQCLALSSNHTFNKEGVALTGGAYMKPHKPECERQKLQQVLDYGRKIASDIQKTESFDEVLKLSYEIDTLKFSSAWAGCSDRANSLLDITTDQVVKPSTLCLITNSTDPAYLADACCNSALSSTSCCLARNISISETFNQGLNNSRIEDECQDSQCVTSYIDEWTFLNSNNLQCSSFSSDEYPALVQNNTKFYTDCKKHYNIDDLALGLVNCRSEEQCEFGGIKNKCNRITGVCSASKEVELATVKCIIQSMSTYMEHYFKEVLDLPGHKDSKEYFDETVKKLSDPICSAQNGDSDSLVFNQQFKVVERSCASGRHCAPNFAKCLDTSCDSSPSVCLTTCQVNWVPQITDKATCVDEMKCNWIGDDCDDVDHCQKNCDEGDFFCSYCFDDSHCAEVPGIKNQDECEKTEACYLPSGKMEFMSAEKCKEQQACTEPCHDGQTCESVSNADDLCVTNDRSIGDCMHTWRSDLQKCVIPHYGPKMCSKSGHQWISCKWLSATECESCYLGTGCLVNQTLMQCHIVPRAPCSTKKECESKGGWCEDASWYTNTSGLTTDDFGACLSPKGASNFGGVFPVCFSGTMSPEACFFNTRATKATCVSPNYWHSLANTKRDCTTNKGCSTYYQINAYSPIPEKQCSECGYESVPYYEWTDGSWIEGIPLELKWKQREVVPLYKWKPTVNFNRMYSILQEAIEATVFADLRSQALCDFNEQSNILQVVSCSCESSSSCFPTSENTVTSAGQPCVGLGSNIQSAFSTITVSANAVNSEKNRCVTITQSYISIYVLQKGEQKPFSPLLKIRDFNSFDIARNDDYAIVGRVMSNGAEIEMSSGLDSYEVCLLVSNSVDEVRENFNTWDLAVTWNIFGDDFVKPLGLKLRSSANNLYCFDVKDPKEKETYFLILRESNWESKDGSLYGSEQIAWWIFAVAYTCLAILSIFTVTLHFFGYKLNFYFLGMFGFFAVMCIIRAVYFYLLGARVFDDSNVLAVAYFLVEFPTLLYFTAFSCLGGFWLYLLYAHMQTKGQTAIFIGCAAFNSVLYLLFVISLILYQTLPSDSNSACKTRVPPNQDNTTQQIISIVYQSTMAGVSLLIAAIVVIFGGKLLLGLKKRKFEGKIAIVTLVCALGLLLHCGFILYLSIVLKYNFTITVLMIVLSELLPIFIITIQFSFLRKPTKKMPVYNRRNRFFKSMNLFKTRTTTSHSSDHSSTQGKSKSSTTKDTASATTKDTASATAGGAGASSGSST